MKKLQAQAEQVTRDFIEAIEAGQTLDSGVKRIIRQRDDLYLMLGRFVTLMEQDKQFPSVKDYDDARQLLDFIRREQEIAAAEANDGSTEPVKSPYWGN